MARKMQAQNLAQNSLLTEILEQRKADIIQQWAGAATPEAREEAWQQKRALELLAGAIEDGIKRAIAAVGDD